MSSIYLVQGWWYYQTYLDSPNGKKRVQKSLKTRDHNTARKRQREWDKKILHDQVRLINRVPWSECMDTYLAHRRKLAQNGQLSQNTINSDIGAFNAFGQFLSDTHRTLYLNDFEDTDSSIEILQSYMQYRRDNGIAANTIRRDLRHISSLFTYYVRPPHRSLSRNPIADIDLPRPTSRVDVPDQKDWLVLRDALRDRVRQQDPSIRDQVLFVMCETGARVSEVLRLKWERGADDRSGSGSQWSVVETEKHQLRIYSKRRERVFPYVQSRELKRFMRWLDQRRMSDKWVFPSPRTGRPLNLSQFNRSFRLLLEELGIKKGFSSHGIRHGFISFLVNSSVSSDQIGWLVGHSSTEITRIYSHPDVESLGKIMSVLS